MPTIEIDEDEVWEVYTVNRFAPHEMDKAYARRDHLNASPRKAKRATYVITVGWKYLRVQCLRPIRPAKLRDYEKRNRFLFLAYYEDPSRSHSAVQRRARALRTLAHREFRELHPDNHSAADLERFYATWSIPAHHHTGHHQTITTQAAAGEVTFHIDPAVPDDVVADAMEIPGPIDEDYHYDEDEPPVEEDVF